MRLETYENVWFEENHKRENQQNPKHYCGRHKQNNGQDVQGRFVVDDTYHYRMGFYIFVHSVLLCVHAIARIQPSHSHAIQVIIYISYQNVSSLILYESY